MALQRPQAGRLRPARDKSRPSEMSRTTVCGQSSSGRTVTRGHCNSSRVACSVCSVPGRRGDLGRGFVRRALRRRPRGTVDSRGEGDRARPDGAGHPCGRHPASLELPVRGTQFRVIGNRGPDLGIAGFWLDGTLIGEFDAYHRQEEPLVTLMQGSLPGRGPHLLRISPTGRRHPHSTGDDVAVDGVWVRFR